MNIKYTVVDCPLGRLLVAATERGVCAITFGESDEELSKALAEKYPRANIQQSDGELQKWVNSILSNIEGETFDLELPLDLQATAFQLRVWEELRRIPYGSTRSYSEVAEAVGRPTAVRAVARACASNPVALVIPCHRVLRSNGDLGGYRWGVERKRELLSKERGGERASKRGA